MKIQDYKNLAQLIRSNTIYDVYDYKMQNLCLSLTELHAGQNTNGHAHNVDEVYIFISGRGQIEIGKEVSLCGEGDVFIIPRGSFHKVQNTSFKELKFWCVFEKYGSRT